MHRWAPVAISLITIWTAGLFAAEPVSPLDPPTAGAERPASDAASQTGADVDRGRASNLADLDIEQLAKVPVRGGSAPTNLTSPSSQLSGNAAETGEATTTADLLKQAPGVSARRVSAITMDPRVRGYHSSQLNATANGMNQLKARLDIDTLFSQIDPGVVENVTVIDGPYTSLYGPGFAFFVADLLPAPRYETPETHLSTNFVYGTNAQALYSRDNLFSGGKDWGVCVSYGLRAGNDYRTGGEDGYLIPSSYQKWDGLMALSFDLDPLTRLELDCLRTDMNNVELPGVVYDIQSSVNEQYNLTYVIQEDRRGPKDVVLQGWYTRTAYHGDASRSSKQASLYRAFFTESDFADPIGYPVNTIGKGSLDSLGVRLLRTFGETDSLQWTLGADWRRYRQWYNERSVDTSGQIVYDGNIFGIPHSQMDDCGALTELVMPLSDEVTMTVGGRVDQCTPSMNANDEVVTEFSVPDAAYYSPGFFQNSNTLGMAYISAKRQLTEASSLKFGTAFAMRNADLTELYNDEPYVPFSRFGNVYISGLSNLRPEKNLQLDLGLGHKTKKMTCGVRGFYSMIRDYIMPVAAFVDPTPPDSIVAPKVLGRNFQYFPAVWRTDIGTINENADTCQTGYQYVNIDDVSLLGGDLFGEYQVVDGFSLFGNMSYVYGVNNSPVQFVADDSWSSPDGTTVPLGGSDGLPGIYPLSGNVGIRFFEPEDDRWSIEFAARMVRGQDHPAVTLAEIAAPGYTTFALRGYYRLRKNVRVSMDIENLFNRAYVEPGSLAIIGPDGLPTFVEEPGISVLMGIEARF